MIFIFLNIFKKKILFSLDLRNQTEIVQNLENGALNGTEEENATLTSGFQFEGMEEHV